MAGLANMLGLGGGMPSPEQMQKLAEKMPGGLPRTAAARPGCRGLPPTMPGLPPKFPGGPLLPGLGGEAARAWADFPDFGKEEMTRLHRRVR